MNDHGKQWRIRRCFRCHYEHETTTYQQMCPSWCGLPMKKEHTVACCDAILVAGLNWNNAVDVIIAKQHQSIRSFPQSINPTSGRTCFRWQAAVNERRERSSVGIRQSAPNFHSILLVRNQSIPIRNQSIRSSSQSINLAVPPNTSLYDHHDTTVKSLNPMVPTKKSGLLWLRSWYSNLRVF